MVLHQQYQRRPQTVEAMHLSKETGHAVLEWLGQERNALLLNSDGQIVGISHSFLEETAWCGDWIVREIGRTEFAVIRHAEFTTNYRAKA